MNLKNKIRLALRDFLNNATSPVIIGGHFAVVNDPTNSKALIPGIFQDCADLETSEWIKRHAYMSHFPSETFVMSLDLLKDNPLAQLLLLVNDWQQVKETNVPKGELRPSFYLENKLPKLFEELSEKEGVDIEQRLFTSQGEFTYHNSFYWSEMILRNKFSDRAEYKNCSLQNGCAQEVTPLFDSCEKAGVDKMLMFVPATCAYPIMQAIGEFKNIRNGKMDVLAVFVTNSLYIEKFWESTMSLNGGQVS